MSERAVRHRVFSRCQTCGHDIARWEDGTEWWHLDGWITSVHPPAPVVARPAPQTEGDRDGE